MKIWIITLLSFLTSFVISIALGQIFIPLLKKLKFGQKILEIGPNWHQNKEGIPTMGGIIFIISTIFVLLLFSWLKTGSGMPNLIFLPLLSGLMFAAIGFLDDLLKIKNKKNLGLRSWQKFALQIIASLIFIVLAKNYGLNNKIYIPIWDNYLDLGIWYIPFAVFVLIGANNAINLTDGLDGLASTVTVLISIFTAFLVDVFYSPYISWQISLICMALAGSLLGFLHYNRSPAKVFMGDTGSLFLGGVIPAIFLLIRNPLILIIIGGIYVIETLSVIIQVISFKTTGKRVFKMSPIHHHFEMIGWNERKIVFVFSMVTIALSILTFLLLLI